MGENQRKNIVTRLTLERAALAHSKITTHTGAQRYLDEQLLIRKAVVVIGSEIKGASEVMDGIYIVNLDGQVLHYLGRGAEVVRNVEALILANAAAFKFISTIDWSVYKELIQRKGRYSVMKKVAYGILGKSVGGTRVEVLPLKSDEEVVIELGGTMKEMGLRQNDTVCYNPDTFNLTVDVGAKGINMFGF